MFRQNAHRPFTTAAILLLLAVIFVSCAKEGTADRKESNMYATQEQTTNDTISETISDTQKQTQNDYQEITQEQAKKLMDSGTNCVILDVRTQEEFDAGHIPGAILIPDYEITEKAQEILTDKDQLILVYCRSGRRSKGVAEELAALGYTNIQEFGGILTWPYETVSE